jgi:hypothetical protein
MGLMCNGLKAGPSSYMCERGVLVADKTRSRSFSNTVGLLLIAAVAASV